MDLKKTAKHIMPATTRIMVIMVIILRGYAKGYAFYTEGKTARLQCAV